jgi:glycosyltransferase involved in cell wall biosynthesis
MMKQKAKALGIEDRVRFTGQVEPSRIPLYVGIADVLVSPRVSGTNTPLKIYSYLKSGKPLVATDLWTHTQVLNEKISILVHPDPESIAEGLSFALASSEARTRADRAKRLSEQLYAPARYNQKMRTILLKAADRIKERKPNP